MEDYDPEEQLKSRQYQTELEEIAMAKNTIIHLPTGSGKTFIAIRIIQRNRHDLKAPWGCGGKRTFFLVNTIPLVTQQKKVIQKMCAVKSVAGYSGEDGVDYWDKNKWDAELSEHEVIVMTSQILADMLTHSYIRIHDINLLIFDECHHAVVDHPMRLVMKHFEGVPVEKQPRVLGLTATLLNANVNINRVEESLRELETTFHATIATVNELGEVLSYSTNPNECVKLYRSSPPTPAAREAISILQELQMIVMKVTLPAMTGDPNIKLERGQRDISTDPKKIVKEVRKMLLSLVMFIEELGAYGGQLSCIAYSILLERLKRKAITTEEEHLYKIAVTHITMARMILLRSMNGDEGYERIVRHSSEKVLLLLNVLKEFNPEYYNKPLAHLRVNQAKQPLSGIIFTKQRFTAKIIYNLLKDVKDANPKEFGFLKHDFIVGFNINPYKATREQFYTKKSSQTALLKFSNKELNCLISTSVIEEGVDIPQCMLVLRYDPPLEYRSYIQSKGRARSSDSTFVLLVNESDRDKFMKQFQSFQITEHYIQKVLVGNTEDRDAPTQENIEDSLYNEDEIPPYVTKHGARLSSVQAISLLNRYCSVLPHDQFTTINPMWVEEKIDDPKKGRLRVIKIYMPIACPVKDLISGEPKAQLKTAKRSAALNACITLHKAGELDYLTLLPKNYGTVDFEQPELMSCFPNWPTDEKKCDSDKKPGTKKRMRKYKKVFSQYLKGLPMSEPRKFYLHVIALDARYPEPSDSRPRALYRLLQEQKGFGLLTMQALPRICEIPICFSQYLKGLPMSEPRKFYLHVIALDARYPEPSDSRPRALYRLLQERKGFGLLTMQALPRICEFPICFSQYLKGLPMSEPRKFYLHVIALDARYPEPSDSRPRDLYRLLQEQKGFGLLTMQALPRICEFLICFSQYLKGLPMSEPRKFYLHVIALDARYPEPSDSRPRALYRLLQERKGFGLLTMQALPRICEFPICVAEGEVNTKLLMNYAAIELNGKTFELVKRFHWFIFDQVLAIKKKFTVFDGLDYALYAVPVTSTANVTGTLDHDIDWEVMQTHTEIRPVVEPSFEERRTLRVTEESHRYRVVSPWYRGIILPSRYIVSNVLEYMTPQSQFAPNSETSYADYYSNKYNLEIMGDKNQPLLEVQRLTSRGFNCLLPASSTIKAFSEKQMKMIALALGEDKLKGFPEVFVPEFCICYDFPSALWYKAGMLPSIMHRVTMLLVAYELRAEIARQTKIGVVHLPAGQEWKPIEVNVEVAVQSLLSFVEPDETHSNNIDRINNPIDEDAPRPMNIVSMKESLYQLQKKKISEEYNWDEKTEPLDIERNISSVTVMDVECYDEFVSTPMSVAPDAASPYRSPSRKLAAILPPPVQKLVKIEILEKKVSARGPELRDVLAAITTINSHDAFNLERTETLGDSFLKFAASLYLHHKFPSMNEGQLTNIKGRLIGNRNLFYAGTKVQLGGRMKVEQFTPATDYLTPGFFAPRQVQKMIEDKQIRPTCLIGLELPPEEVLSGNLSEESFQLIRQKLSADNESTLEKEPFDGVQVAMQCHVRAQAVADKSLADCVESLVGTYLLSDGILGGVKVLEWLKVLPPQDNFEALLTRKIPTVLTENKTTAAEVNRVMDYCREDIEKILNYKFKDPAFLLEALSHPSYIRNRLTRSYERLEFLGDAILDFLITSHIFESCPSLNPGDLTDLRSALVNNVTFASYVVKMGLHKYLCYQLNPCLETAIMAFIEHQERREHNIQEDVLYLIDEEDCMIAEYVEVPKVLSDIFESLAGAIYLDSGGDLKAVWAVFYRIMCNEIHAFSRNIPKQPVRLLYENIHACPQIGKPRFPNQNLQKVMVPITVTKSGKQYTVHGCGTNKFQARRAAAKLALKVLAI